MIARKKGKKASTRKTSVSHFTAASEVQQLQAEVARVEAPRELTPEEKIERMERDLRHACDERDSAVRIAKDSLDAVRALSRVVGRNATLMPFIYRDRY